MSVYDKIAGLYSKSMSEEGDYHHRTQIDPNVYSVIGNPKDKVIYDIGCGNGYMARHLAKQGAKVYASDISSKLIEEAKKKSKNVDIFYSVHDATDFSDYKTEMFDIVLMNMVIHYIKDLDKLFDGVNKVLKRGGLLVFSTTHPFRPSPPYSEWVEGEIERKKTLFIKATGYLKKESRTAPCWLDDKTILNFYNQPLNQLINTMSKHNLFIFRLEEPEPDGFAHNFSKELQKSHHIPTFIIIGARKFF